ncbi:hypothetical protein KKF84_03045 [Myxococcota bacterium]|nr:hypothetical protein [Myxococcota bacterium]MBU1534266.1 hypothetical protein [Myxococcota bacterium]
MATGGTPIPITAAGDVAMALFTGGTFIAAATGGASSFPVPSVDFPEQEAAQTNRKTNNILMMTPQEHKSFNGHIMEKSILHEVVFCK